MFALFVEDQKLKLKIILKSTMKRTQFDSIFRPFKVLKAESLLERW
jgi:hypothetical protein